MLQEPDEGLTPLTPPSIILWVGPKHSGKTTSAACLVQTVRDAGFAVAGCLAPSVYANNSLLGFDVVNLRSGERGPLARRETGPGPDRKFRLITEGLGIGNEALNSIATQDADLIVVDEYGPWELTFQGWRTAVDRLMTSTDAVLLLVVREELVDAVQTLYGAVPTRRLVATQQKSIDEVLAVLRNNRL